MKSLLIAPAAVLLAACGAAPTPAVTVTAPTTVTATAPAPAPVIPESSDGETMRDLLSTQGFDYSGPASDLEDLADSICGALDNDIDPALLVQVAIDNGFSMEEGAALVAASIVVVCPRHRSAV